MDIEFDNINNDEKSTESSSNNSNIDEFDNINNDEKSTESPIKNKCPEIVQKLSGKFV
jgi:hypothetical protein